MIFHYMPLIWLVVLGIGFYLVNRYVTMEPVFRTVVRIVAVVIAFILLLATFGLIGSSHLAQ
jgi:arginine exporter protein ArgO